MPCGFVSLVFIVSISANIVKFVMHQNACVYRCRWFTAMVVMTSIAARLAPQVIRVKCLDIVFITIPSSTLCMCVGVSHG